MESFNFSNCRPVSTPIETDSEILKSGKVTEGTNFPYRQAVGALMYLMVGTRPDLAYAIGLENPTNDHVVKLKRVFRYISGTINFGIAYKPGLAKELECYSDADFGGCTKTGRSTSGVVINSAGGIISWSSQRQSIVATSTTEAELVAANEATKEVIWLNRLFSAIIKLDHIPVLQIDNSAAVRLAQNPEFHHRTKHIDIKHFFIREKVLEEKLAVQQISSQEQVADVLTKPLPRTRLLIMCSRMGLS